ncbi:MAG: PAS domain S-box protein, partial [Chitinophagaceae bacterium]
PIINSLIAQVLAGGEATWSEDQLIPIYRNGKLEDVYWTFSYSPVNDESGKVAGVLVTCSETTDKIITLKKIEESEERFRTMAESSDILIVVSDGTSNATYFNKAWADLTGRPIRDLLDFGWADLIHPDDRQGFMDIYLSAFEKRQSWSGEFRIMDKNGRYRYLLAKGPPRFQADGTFAGYISSCVDITELKQTDEALKESEQRYRNLIMKSPISMAIFRGPDHIIEMANTAMQERWGRRGSNYLNRKVLVVFPELRNQKFSILLDTVYATGIPHRESESIAYIKEKDELKTYYLDFEYAPLFETNGKVSGILATVNDVTDRVAARKKLEESEKRFRVVADSAPALIWMAGTDKGCTYFNRAWLNFTGRTMEQENGNAWAEGVHPDDFKRCLDMYVSTFDKRKEFYMEYRLKRHDGQYRWISDTGVPRFTSDGIFEGYIGACLDIQDQKSFSVELEKQVKDRTGELEQKNNELEKMNRELQSFAYISSHDLQEPLRKIQTFSSRIMEKEFEYLSDDGKDKFRRMQNAAKRMQTLIEDLLTYSRTTTTERKFEKTDLRKVVEEVKEDLNEELERKNATIDIDEMCDAIIIPFQFRQLMYNLLSNSLKFSNEEHRPQIKVKGEIGSGLKFNHEKLSGETSYCHISISDNGIGFEPQYSERIFEVFQRLHGKEQYNGTGIGLAIVKKIVENHNGIVTATGEVGKGATFDVYLPDCK